MTTALFVRDIQKCIRSADDLGGGSRGTPIERLVRQVIDQLLARDADSAEGGQAGPALRLDEEHI